MGELFLQIQDAYFKDDFNEVIKIWEQSPIKEVSFISKEDFRLYMALADSYHSVGAYGKSIKFCNRLIHYKLKQPPGEDREKDLLFYFSIKSGSYRDQEKLFLSYLTIREYIKKGGTDAEFIKNAFLLEEHLILPFFRKLINWFTYLYGAILSIHYLTSVLLEIRIVSSAIILPFTVFGLVWI